MSEYVYERHEPAIRFIVNDHTVTVKMGDNTVIEEPLNNDTSLVLMAIIEGNGQLVRKETIITKVRETIGRELNSTTGVSDAVFRMRRVFFGKIPFDSTKMIPTSSNGGYYTIGIKLDDKNDTPENASSASIKSDSGGLEAEIKSLFRNIVASIEDVNSYAFVHKLHEGFLPWMKPTYIPAIVQVLEQYTESSEDDTSIKNCAFAIYYAIGLYLNRNKTVAVGDVNLDSLIQSYANRFDEEVYPLKSEVASWYYRRLADSTNQSIENRKNYLNLAIKSDKELMSKLTLKKNAGVYASFASTVSHMLELEYTEHIEVWDSPQTRMKDWENSRKYMDEVIEEYSSTWGIKNGYGKHHFILGKLYLFAPQGSKEIEKAKTCFLNAYQLEADLYRKSMHQKYVDKCEQYRSPDRKATYKIEFDYGSKQNTRLLSDEESTINKPIEDCIQFDIYHHVYVLTDGVTRPHYEYFDNNSESYAYKCAKALCNKICETICSNNRKEDPKARLTDAIIAGNNEISTIRTAWETQRKEWRTIREGGTSKPEFYPPCCALIVIYIFEDTAYFFNCCDTIGILIRNGLKMQFSEQHNWYAETMKKNNALSKGKIYVDLHNKPDQEGSFAIANGSARFNQMIQIGQFQILPGDRIILASDGLQAFLSSQKGDRLKELTAAQICYNSCCFDQPPFNDTSYADDKSCIIIDIKET